MYSLFIGISVGIIFGFAFEKSKVFEAASIIGQLLFKRFIMLKVLVTAMITSGLVLTTLNTLGIFEFYLKNLNLYTNIIGGGLLGAGIAFAGACPGTVFAQIAVGYKDAFFTVAGALFSAFIYSFYNLDINAYFQTGHLGKMSIADLIPYSPITISLTIAFILTAFLFILERNIQWHKELG
ncbi:MAG: YeeE/YedE thiosulfate transporter family protein [Alphaproteobacteria bacterium]|nr:YeeE/YedE thiosulfate transporter family protein [Alphaproteobacteria bacterium]